MIAARWSLVVVDDEQPADGAVDERLDPAEDGLENLDRSGLLDDSRGAGHQGGLRLLDARDDVHRDVPRRRVALQPVEHRPAVHHRQAHVEHDRVRLELACEGEPGVAAQRDESLEAALACDLQLGAGEVGVVLDDQDDAVARLDRVAVVLDLARDEQRRIEVVDVRLAAVRRVGAAPPWPGSAPP